MDIEDVITSPLPAYTREPLLMVVDACEERCRWVVPLLAFANYRVYTALTPFEAFTWHLEHPVLPQALLLGRVSQQELLFVDLVLQRMTTQSGTEIPMVFLAVYLPDRVSVNVPSFSPGSQGYFALLETLWRVVTRYV